VGDVEAAVTDFIEDAWEAVVDIVQIIWDYVCMPILEEIFSWFGIEDETVVSVQKVSTLVFGDNTEDVVHKSIVRAVLKHVKTDTSFFANYMVEIYTATAQMRSYHRYGKSRYTHGLPEMQIKGGTADHVAIAAALNTDLGGTFTVLSTDSTFPDADRYFQYYLQATPYFYFPYLNTLTFTDPHGVVRTDYSLDSVVFNSGTNDYSLNISRIAELAIFWITGIESVIEGGSVTYTVHSNRLVPVGESVNINFAYTGTAIDGTDYTSVASVTMLASTDTIDIVIATIENIVVDGVRDMIITIDSITNTNAAFEEVAIDTLNSITTAITDDDALMLTIPHVIIGENDTNALINVTLTEATATAFTVDYSFTNITAVAGLDYDNTPGTLNFVGTAGEVQTITVPITPDVADDDNEQFSVELSNCSDALVDISYVGVVTIVDGTADTPLPGTAIVTGVITRPNYIAERTLILRYHESSAPASEWFFWLYEYSALTYANLEPTLSLITNLEMLPVAILRKDKVSINSDKTTPEYKTTKQLTNKLALNLDDMIDNIEANPDIAVIDDVYINFAVCTNSTNHLVSRVIYMSFYELIVTNGLTSNTNEYSISFTEQDINNAIVWTDQEYISAIVGVIAEVGVFTHSVSTVIESIPDEFGVPQDTTVKTLVLQHQISATEYDEIRIKNLNGMAAIAYGAHHNIAFNTLGDDDFTLPISWFVVQDFKPEEFLELYQHMLRLDFYAIQVTELEWYETSAFTTLFKFVLIAITVFSLFTAAGPLTALYNLLVSYAVMEVVIYVAELTGNAEFAALVAIVAMIVLSNTGVVDMTNMTTAEQLLSYSTNFANNLAASYTVLGEELAQDLQNLNEEADARLEEIREAGEGLDQTVDPTFMAALNSVEMTRFPAIQLQYEFDQVYDFDALVSNFVKNRLLIGVV